MPERAKNAVMKQKPKYQPREQIKNTPTSQAKIMECLGNDLPTGKAELPQKGKPSTLAKTGKKSSNPFSRETGIFAEDAEKKAGIFIPTISSRGQSAQKGAQI